MKTYLLFIISGFALLSIASAQTSVSVTYSPSGNASYASNPDGSWDVGVAAAWWAPPSGTVTHSGGVAWSLNVAYSGTSIYAPTASGSATIIIESGSQASAGAFSGCSSSGTGSADSEFAYYPVTGPASGSTPAQTLGTAYTVSGSSLSFVQQSDGSWLAVYGFHTASVNAVGSGTAPTGSKGANGLGAGWSTTYGGGLTSNTIAVTPHN